jgi:hypothetical protein
VMVALSSEVAVMTQKKNVSHMVSHAVD